MRALTYPAARLRRDPAPPRVGSWRRGARTAAPASRLRPVPRAVAAAFLLFVATLPFEAAAVLVNSGTFSLAKLSGLFFFASYFFYFNPAIGKRGFAGMPAPLLWFLGYVFVFVMGGLFIGRDLVAPFLSLLATLVQLLVVFWIACHLLQDEKIARAALLTFAAASFVLALAMLLHVPGFSVVLETKSGERFTSLEYNPNVLATIMALAAIMVMGLRIEFFAKPVWNRALLVVLMLPLLGVVVRTGSRAGMIAVMLGFGIFLFFRDRRAQGKKGTSILVVLVGIVVLGYLVASSSMALIRFRDAYEGNLSGRDKINAAAIEMAVQRPVFGWQPMAFWQELGRRVGLFAGTRDAHNLFLHLILEVGLVGTLPFLVGLGICLWNAWKARGGPFGALPLALYCAILFANLSHTFLTRKPFWLVLALCVASYRSARRAPAPALPWLRSHPLARAPRPRPALRAPRRLPV